MEPDRTDISALHWAESFCITKIEERWTLNDIDVDLMLGWFANYWATVNDPLEEQIEALQQQLAELREAAQIVVDRMRGSGGINPDAADALLGLAALSDD